MSEQMFMQSTGVTTEGKVVFQQPLITVVMPTYKHMPYIGKAFQGILDQTYQNIEVIVVSYKEDLATSHWMTSEMQLPPNWFWMESSVAYAIHQLNIGFEKAKGKYIVFASTDDFFYPDKIRTDVEVAIKNKAWVSYGPFQHGDANLNIKDTYDPPHPITYLQMMGRDLIPDCSLISKKAFDECGLWDEALGESGGPIWDFWLKILEKDEKLFAYNPYVGWIYRQGEQQTSARRPPVDQAIRKWMLERSLRRSGRLV